MRSETHAKTRSPIIRTLNIETGVTGLSPRQLRVFVDPDRDDRGWVLSVVHLDAVPFERLTIDESLARLAPVTDVPEHAYGRQQIIELVVTRLRADYVSRPDPADLQTGLFTLRNLEALREVVAGTALPRDTFRRGMEGQLVPTGLMEQGSVGKPARLFARLLLFQEGTN